MGCYTNGITKLAAVAFLIASTVLVTACGKSGSGGGGKPATNGNATVAHVPSPKVCLSEGTINPNSNSWGLYQASGFTPRAWSSGGGTGAAVNASGVGISFWAGVYYRPSYNYGYGGGYGGGYGYGSGYGGYRYGYPGYGYGHPYGYNNPPPIGGNYGSGNNGGHQGGGSTVANCACPSGTVPACDTTGMTCVSSYDLSAVGSNIAMYNYDGTKSFVFDNYHGQSGWYSNSGQCRVAQACVVGTSSCGYGTCRPLRTGGTVGVCVK